MKQGRGVVRMPTEAQMDAIAGWWQAKGSNVKAAMLLGRSPQTVRNTLCLFRQLEGVDSNIDLAMRYLEQIKARDLMGRAA